MSSSGFLAQARQHAAVGMSLFALIANLGASTPAYAQPKHATAVTPIQHVIVIIGENRTFDHVYATYQSEKRPDCRQPALQRHCQPRRFAWHQLRPLRAIQRRR